MYVIYFTGNTHLFINDNNVVPGLLFVKCPVYYAFIVYVSFYIFYSMSP